MWARLNDGTPGTRGGAARSGTMPWHEVAGIADGRLYTECGLTLAAARMDQAAAPGAITCSKCKHISPHGGQPQPKR